jgi:hypothetical protein
MRRLTHEKVAQDQHDHTRTENLVVLRGERHRKARRGRLFGLRLRGLLDDYFALTGCDLRTPFDFRNVNLGISSIPVKTEAGFQIKLTIYKTIRADLEASPRDLIPPQHGLPAEAGTTPGPAPLNIGGAP